MDYSKFSVEDFMTDDYFLQWVSQNDPEAEKFWNLFISLNPETKPKIDMARSLVLNLKRTAHTHVSDSQIENIWAGVQNRIQSAERPVVKQSRSVYIRYGIAASLILIALLIGAIKLSNKKQTVNDAGFTALIQSSTEDFFEEVNTSSKTIRIHLSDGSIVNLEKNSRLRYKKSYIGDESRNVFLTGEAFFEVAKNPGQPFFVHANEVVTKVLGTSFRITAYGDQKNITVAVKSGKVSVFSAKKPNTSSRTNQHTEVKGVVLLPNQQVVYQRDDESFDKTLVGSPVVLSPAVATNDFIFENAPIHEVFRVLESAYGIEIIFDEEVMNACFITAPLGAEPLFEKLRIICRTIGADYEIIDTKVVINSSGC
jgi:hypothetical protein